MEEILKWGGIASAIGAILGLGAKLWKWYSSRKSARREEEKAFQNKVLSKLEDVQKHAENNFLNVQTELFGIKNEIKDSQDSIGYLQCDRLMQSYDHWMEVGYCPTEAKTRLLKMYDAYHKSGRNTVADGFKDDIQDLPPFPPVRTSVKGGEAGARVS